jgi:Nucleotide modification associated domain 1
MSRTPQQYLIILNECRQLFIKKNQDYGTAWRVLRPSSITDQIYIKAARIQSIDQKQDQKVQDSIENEFVGIVNYCIMDLIQLERENQDAKGETGNVSEHLSKQNVLPQYNLHAERVYQLMLDKNHDYDEVWRSMRISSMTDLILMKIIRMKEIEDQRGNTLVSEGVDANVMDIMNYAIFALILIKQSINPNF